MPSPHLEVRNRFLAKCDKRLCYGLGEWRRYEAGAWGSVPELEIKREIQFLAAKVPKLTVTNGVVTSVTELVRQCVSVSDLIFDSNPNIIIFRDCVLDLTTWDTVPHSADHYATSKLSFDYDPDARLDEWDRFLLHLPHPDFMRRYAGLCMTPETKYEIALWLWGPPGGGKSTYIEALCAMLGAKACVLGLSEIERSQFALSQLPGRTLAISTEMPSRIVRSPGIINAIISGELIPVERKYVNPYTIRPHAKIIWGMNQLPHIGSEGVGIFRRVLPVHFPAIPEAERDPKLKEAILRSPMVVANWALKGWRQVQSDHSLNVPAELAAARDNYRQTNDLTLQFVNNSCDRDAESRIKSTVLYGKYKDWTTAFGHRRASIQDFTADLYRLGFKQVKPYNVSHWEGLRLADDSDLDSNIIVDDV
jgi:P4 family phage/plasmid primase-like protien